MSDTTMLNKLITLCLENDVICNEGIEDYANADIFESGLIDSAGLAYMQVVIEQHFNIDVPTEMFLTELRDLTAIADYLQQESGAAHV